MYSVVLHALQVISRANLFIPSMSGFWRSAAHFWRNRQCVPLEQWYLWITQISERMSSWSCRGRIRALLVCITPMLRFPGKRDILTRTGRQNNIKISPRLLASQELKIVLIAAHENGMDASRADSETAGKKSLNAQPNLSGSGMILVCYFAVGAKDRCKTSTFAAQCDNFQAYAVIPHDDSHSLQ